jgi:hypothetical protein
MESTSRKMFMRRPFAFVTLLVIATVGLLLWKLQTQDLALAKTIQMTFQSPTDAGAALATAAEARDQATLAKILGPDANALLITGDPQVDEPALNAFIVKYQQMNRWVNMGDGSRVLYIGADNFSFPVPLAQNSSGQWYFDVVAGAQEIRARDVGRNEFLAIDACAAVANAEEVYFVTAGSFSVFAQRIISSPGKQDGLYWPVSETQAASPLGSITEFPASSLASSLQQEPLVLDGYSLRILTAQGDEAPGGAESYAVNGKMTGGFAVLATPVKYGETGIMTFMTGDDGIVYERNLGPDTTTIAASIKVFNPTDDWSPVEF